MGLRKSAFLPAICIGLLLGAVTVDTIAAQNLGHKLPGLIGLDAGRVPEPGLYLIDRLVYYAANELRDGQGNLIPTEGLQMWGLSNALGLSYTFKLNQGGLLLTATAAAPLARLSLNIHDR